MNMEELLVTYDSTEANMETEIKVYQSPSNEWKPKSVKYDKETNTILIEI